MIRDRAATLRQEYEAQGLVEGDMADDPFTQFDSWFEGVVEAGLHEPNTFVLATADAEGRPSARALLMKDFGSDGLVFFTNYESRKSLDLAANPRAAATFVWLPLHRQVRFEGTVERLTDEDSDEYFARRPRGARIAAHASDQSRPVETREEMYERFAEADAAYGDVVPRPATWGGWRLRPERVEFWQGQPNRFHDRVVYSMTSSTWEKGRIAP